MYGNDDKYSPGTPDLNNALFSEPYCIVGGLHRTSRDRAVHLACRRAHTQLLGLSPSCLRLRTPSSAAIGSRVLTAGCTWPCTAPVAVLAVLYRRTCGTWATLSGSCTARWRRQSWQSTASSTKTRCGRRATAHGSIQRCACSRHCWHVWCTRLAGLWTQELLQCTNAAACITGGSPPAPHPHASVTHGQLTGGSRGGCCRRMGVRWASSLCMLPPVQCAGRGAVPPTGAG